MKPGPVLLVFFALWATGCVITANAGRYIPDDRPDPTGRPTGLRVGLVPFLDHQGKQTEDTQRLTESFYQDIQSAGIFSEVVQSDQDVDVLLSGQVLRMQQPIAERHMDNDAMGFVIPMVLSSLGVLPILGVPTDCGKGEAAIVVRAKDPRFGQEFRHWQGRGTARSCSGLYYRGWPLSKALSRAAGQILSGMRGDARSLKRELDLIQGWYRDYGLATTAELGNPAAVPALIRALGDQDERVRVRAVAALANLKRAAALATPALTGCLADDDPAVRRESILALLALKAHDETTLSRLAALRRKNQPPGARRDIDRAVRALTFLDLSSDLTSDLSAHVAHLGSLDPSKRTQAVTALGRLGNKSRPALTALQLALKDPEADVRLQAVLALEAIGAYDHQPSRTALKIRSKTDRSKTVRQAAREALRRLELRALAEGKPIEERVPPKKIAKKVVFVDGPVVAVFLTQETARHLKRAQLADYLAVQLTSECGFRIVPQDQIKQRLMKEKKETYRHCYDQRCRIELGKAVAAEKILAVRIFKTDQQCVVTANLYDLRTEATERAATARAVCSDAALISALDTIARQLSQTPRISRQ